MHVLHDEQAGLAGESLAQLAQSLEGSSLDHLGTEPIGRLAALTGVQKVEEARRRPERVHRAFQCRAQLLADTVWPIGLDDGARRPQKLDERQIGDRRCVG